MGHEIAGSVSAVGEQLVNDPNYKKVLDLLCKLLKLVECVIHVVKDMMVFVI